MTDDLALRTNPQYRHLFDEKPVAVKPEVKWMKPQGGLVNSVCGQYQVRKSGDPPEYSLFSIRVPPFARLIRGGFKSFDEVREFLGRPNA